MHSKPCWTAARRGAVKARTAAIQQIKVDLLVTAPAEIRERYRGYTTTLTLVLRCPDADPLHTTIPSRSRS